MLSHEHMTAIAFLSGLFAASSILIELLRDWLDPRSFLHSLAAVIIACSAVPILLLPPDHQYSDEVLGAVSLFTMYEAARWTTLSLLFVVVPGVSRGRCAAALGVLGLAVLSFVTPLLTLWLPDSATALQLPPGKWASDLLSWQRGGAQAISASGRLPSKALANRSVPAAQAPRALLDAPLGFGLLWGAFLLAVHVTNGAVALPRLLAPPPKHHSNGRRARSNAMLLANLRAQLEATQEERRSLASQFDLRGRAKGKAQQQRQANLEHREQQLRAQIAGVGGTTSKVASAWDQLRWLRFTMSTLLLLLALGVGGSLAASLALHAARSPCGLACGFLLPPEEAHVIDASASADAAAEAAAAAAVPLSGGFTTGFTNTSALAAAQTAAAAAVAAAAAAALPLDALLIRAARAPPLDTLVLALLLALLISWVVVSSSVGFSGSRASAPNVSAIRYRGSSTSALLALAVRLAFCVLSFGAMLLTLAPKYSRAVSEYGVPGLSVAARSVIAITVRLPFFGMVWYCAQCGVAACLLLHLGVRALFALCRLVRPSPGLGHRNANGYDVDEYGSDEEDEERTPLRSGRSY